MSADYADARRKPRNQVTTIAHSHASATSSHRRCGQSRRGRAWASLPGNLHATYLAEKHGLKAVQINPCVNCDGKLAAEVGKVQKNWHSGEEYEFSAQHLAELQALKVRDISRPERYLLLVETGDEVLDYREAVAYFRGARQLVLEGGDHGFSRFADYIPTILEF